MMRLGARGALLLAAFFAPGLVYAARAGQTGNAETAIDGLMWGLLASVIALFGFAISFQTSPLAQLMRFAGGLVAVVAAWSAVLWWASIRTG